MRAHNADQCPTTPPRIMIRREFGGPAPGSNTKQTYLASIIHDGRASESYSKSMMQDFKNKKWRLAVRI